MEGSKKTKNTVLKGVVVVLALVFVISAVALGLSLWEKSNGEYKGDGENIRNVINYEGKEYVFRTDIETFAVIGLDKTKDDIENNSYNNDQQADFLLLFVIDNTNKKWSAVHINRDTITKMNVLGVGGKKVGTVEKQISLAHTYGSGKDDSCGNVTSAISNMLLGATINHYLSAPMDFVPEYNDMVGGVEVEILDDFTAIDSKLVKGEKVVLSGEQALLYVRERAGLEDSTNSTRMKRQQQYLSALYEKTKKTSVENGGFAKDAVAHFISGFVSDCNSGRLETIFAKLTEYEFSGINTIEGENVKGEEFMEFYPDEKAVNELVVKLFCKEKN